MPDEQKSGFINSFVSYMNYNAYIQYSLKWILKMSYPIYLRFKYKMDTA